MSGDSHAVVAERITQDELRKIVPKSCPKCGNKEIRVKANTLNTGASLYFSKDDTLLIECDANEGIADLAWGYECTACGLKRDFPEEYEIVW